ncbi:MAG: trimethylamine methyltransferase family protein, partial [Pseudomonadota bacterium]
MMEAPARRRRGGRTAMAERRGMQIVAQMPWRQPINNDRPTAPLTEEGVQAIHEAAMEILEEIGIDILNDTALAILKRAGCKADGHKVFLDRAFVMEMVAKAPSRWTLTPRNPDRKITIGGTYMAFGNVSSPPNYWDMELGRKVPGTRAQCADLLKLTQYFNCIHFAGGYPVEAVDVHPAVRHLDVLFDKLTLTDKV